MLSEEEKRLKELYHRHTVWQQQYEDLLVLLLLVSSFGLAMCFFGFSGWLLALSAAITAAVLVALYRHDRARPWR